MFIIDNNVSEMKKAAKAWSIWEGRTSKLVQDPFGKYYSIYLIDINWHLYKVESRFGGDKFSLAFAR